MAKKGQKFNSYSEEIKEEVLKKYFEEYMSSGALEKEYGISQKKLP